MMEKVKISKILTPPPLIMNKNCFYRMQLLMFQKIVAIHHLLAKMKMNKIKSKKKNQHLLHNNNIIKDDVKETYAIYN